MNPAPTEARTSRTGSRNPVGAAFRAGSWDSDSCVLAMHTGRLPKPSLAARSSWFLAVTVKSTSSAP
jgi:hypothetical protein